jgi:CheY-like chemotaxis protein
MELVGVVLAPVEEEVPAREEVLCPPPPPEGDEDSLPRAQAVAVPDYRSTRVLVVDPEGGGGVELAKSLESMGFSPVVARTGQEACQKMDGGGWAACVLVTGPDPAWARMVLRVGKQRYPGVCFLAATGEADPDVTAGLVVEGAADVLEPPWPKGLALAASMHVAMPDRVAPPPGTHGRVLVELASRHVKAIRAAVQAEGAPPLADAGESLLDRRGVTQLADALVALRDPLGQAAAYLERLAMAGVAVDGEAGRHLATLRAVQAELGKAGRLRVR